MHQYHARGVEEALMSQDTVVVAKLFSTDDNILSMDANSFPAKRSTGQNLGKNIEIS